MSQYTLPARQLFRQIHIQRGMIFGMIILGALLAFEVFNYSTTEYALTDLLGNLRFAGLHWSTILSIAFCGIDFAGIARLFTPSINSTVGMPGPNETWYLFGAWLLAASMNAILTWWGVSLAIIGHETLGNAMIGQTTLLRVVPIFVAVMVWLIRVLIIGTFSVAGDSLFLQAPHTGSGNNRAARPGYGNRPALPLNSGQAQVNRSVSVSSGNFGRKPVPPAHAEFGEHSEPTYHPLSAITGRIDKFTDSGQHSTQTRHF